VRVLAILLSFLLVGTAAAAPAVDELAGVNIVFARNGALIKSDARGKNETELVKLPGKAQVRALRTDAQGNVLLVDLDGVWWWMPVDASKPLAQLPCDAGPAQLSAEGRFVLCRNKQGGSLVVNLESGRQTPLGVPPLGARLVSNGSALKLVWTDRGAVYVAIPPKLDKPVIVAKQAPLRSFSVSPDGTRAVGVYATDVFQGAKTKKPGESLMVFGLDGEGARRRVIQNGVPLDWSHDSRWVLVQENKAGACIMLAVGGQYKCWRGYTAASISSDGKYALVFGNRDKARESDKKSDKKSKKKKGDKSKDDERDADADEDANGELEGDEHGDIGVTDDVALPPPSGPLALYRAELAGPFVKSPALVARVVEGAAVWIPAKR
jgi:hypothetical protein